MKVRQAKWLAAIFGAIAFVVLGTGCMPQTSSSSEPLSYTPKTGIPELPSEKDQKRVDAFESWVEDFTLYEFEASYYSDGDLADVADELRDAAKEYPQSGSRVPGALRAAAKRIDAADKALGNRQYERGRTQLEEARADLKPVKKALLDDWAKVEAMSGLRIADTSSAAAYIPQESAKVIEWVDGDTVVTDQGEVRLIGIDTPEMSDQCSRAQEAKEYVESLAPRGTKITLLDPYSVDDEDKYGRLLRYVDREDGVDVGYSLLLSNLAKARYESQDGYQWHPRERAYRAVKSEPTRKLKCHWESAKLAKQEHDGGRDDDERDRTLLRKAITTKISSAKLLPKTADEAKDYHAMQDRIDRQVRESEAKRDGSSGGGSSGGGSGGCPPGGCYNPCPPGGC